MATNYYKCFVSPSVNNEVYIQQLKLAFGGSDRSTRFFGNPYLISNAASQAGHPWVKEVQPRCVCWLFPIWWLSSIIN